MEKHFVPEHRHGLVGVSGQIATVRRLIDKAALNRLPVLLLGESGTGKEVVARAIHQANPRGRFVPIDCGSLVGTLMESELFGHVKGAFSGAVETKKGLIETASGGTAFFDEIGDLPLEMQVKILRVIQEREFRSVGGTEPRKVDLRIIAATHRNLKEEVAAGRFRLDLFYRLNVIVIRLPALRERREDIPLLLNYFLRDSEAAGLEPLELGPELVTHLTSYCWPGNVRELKNCVERVAAMHTDGFVSLSDLPSSVRNYCAQSELVHMAKSVEACSDGQEIRTARPFPLMSIRDCEMHAITRALEETRGRRARAAELLRVSRTTLYRRIKEYGIA